MAYNSSHTGAQIDAAVGAVREKESIWDGKGAGDMLASVYDPKGKAQDVFRYADAKASAAKSAANTAQTGLNTHIANKSNPHGVTAAQVGADAKGSAAQALTDAKAYTDSAIQVAIQDTWEASY